MEEVTDLDFPDIELPKITAAHIDGFGKRPSAFITDPAYDDYVDNYFASIDADTMLEHVGDGGDHNQGLIFDHLLNVHIPTVVKGSALLVGILAIALIIRCCCPSCGSCIKYAARRQREASQRRAEEATRRNQVAPAGTASPPPPLLPPAPHLATTGDHAAPVHAPNTDQLAAHRGARYVQHSHHQNGYSAASFPTQATAPAPSGPPPPPPALVVNKDGTATFKVVYDNPDKKEHWEY